MSNTKIRSILISVNGFNKLKNYHCFETKSKVTVGIRFQSDDEIYNDIKCHSRTNYGYFMS